MANYRKLKVHEVGTDTYVDYEANVSDHRSGRRREDKLSISSINEFHVHVPFIQVRFH